MGDYSDLGPYRRAVTTQSPQAQTWFDRGLLWFFGYNHDESVACFQRAVRGDPGLANARTDVPVQSSCFCKVGSF